MEYLNYDSLFLPMMTAIGAFGGMPNAPKIFQDLAKNEWFQWLMVFVLIYQGGGSASPELSAVATIVVYVVVKLLDMMYEQKEGYYY